MVLRVCRSVFCCYSKRFLEGRRLPSSMSDFHERVHKEAESPDDSRFLRLAIIGMPNAGKSELTNKLVGSPVSAVSAKVNTTRKLTTGIAIDGNTQLMILDTPGIISKREAVKKFKTGTDAATLLDHPEKCISQAQLIVVIVDATHPYDVEQMPYKMLYLLHKYRVTPSILVLNKVDLVKNKATLLNMTKILTEGKVGGLEVNASSEFEPKLKKPEEILKEYSQLKYGTGGVETPQLSLDENEKCDTEDKIRRFDKQLRHMMVSELRKYFRDTSGWPHFSAVFYISALYGDGLDGLREYLINRAQTGQWRFHRSVITNKRPSDVCLDVIRGKLMDTLPADMAYKLRLRMVVWEETEEGVLTIRVDIVCDKNSYGRAVIGLEGRRIKQICADANQTLRNLLQQDLYLKLSVVYSEQSGLKKYNFKGGARSRDPTQNRSKLISAS